MTLPDVRQFRERSVTADGFCENVEGMLLKWLIEYLDSHQAKEEVIDYAYDYWIYWIEKLGRFLQQPVEPCKSLHDWFIL
ncbi:MAG: hypothetical protein O7E52_23410 [Candidatus Poribacteria bacterium]|nr:hypothetical protein [Candidatus Poribacteria bacterium]